jgi:hypothetical protein
MLTMESLRIIYSRGFPYGAPLAMLRGGGTKNPAVKDFIKSEGFRWNDSQSAPYAWSTYMDRSDFGPILKRLRDEFGCTVVPKDSMDTNYIIDLDDPDFGRPKEA